MGLASKIKNTSSAPSTTPQPQQHSASLYEGVSAPGYAPPTGYPPPQQRTGSYAPAPPQQRTGSYDSRYGTSPPPQYEYPQHVGKEHMQPLQHGAPSAPPLTQPQQYYGGGYAAPHQHLVQPHQQSRVESTPYLVQGQSPPYAGQGPISPSYGEQAQYYGGGYTAPHEHPVQPHRQSHVESTPYAVQGQSSPYAGQVPISPPYGVQGQSPPYAGQGPISPSYGEQAQRPSSTYGVFSHVPRDAGAQPIYMQPATSIEMMAHKLQAIIQANGLQAFYDQGSRFQAILQNVAHINYAEIAAQWNISIELAYDLAPLALYDIVFFCDDSGSMAFEENGERIDDLKLILSKVSDIATKFDDDGIIVRFMNSDVNGDGIRNAADVANLISKVRFSGMTPLGTNLDRKVIQPFVLGQAMSNMAKPVLAIVITDGEPSGEDHGTIRQVIHRAKDALMRTRYGGGAFAVQIAQVGKDARTQRFLESLDNDPVIGGMIDCTSYYELEEEEFARKGVLLTPELWLLKMCVGAIDPEYDSKDD